MDKVKIGIIGAGNMGSAHIQSILAGKTPEITLTCVADRSEARREWAKDAAPGVAIFPEGSELIKSGLADAVLIAVPHYQHPVLAIEAFEQGLHVMCEKPAGVYTLKVREMNEAAKKSGRVFGMMFNQRTNCVYKKLHDMMQNGELGELKRVNWIITDWYRTQYYYDSGAWRATWGGEGGGVLLNQCPHNLDLIQWIAGMPSSVRAFCHNGKWHDIEVEDDVTAYLEYPNGATGVFVTTTGDAPGTNRLEVTGTLGRAITDGHSLTVTMLDTDEREFCRESRGSFDRPGAETHEVELDGANPQHVGVLNAFAANILRGDKLVADGSEGINGLTLSNAMHLSSWLDKKIDIPFDEELFLRELDTRRATSRLKADVETKAEDLSGTY